MSVTSAMMSGVTGLLSNAEAINVIGNNISNVNTVGFKYGRTLFSDLLSQNITSNSQVGKGTQIQAVENIFSQGATLSSENATDISISGRGFFIVQDDSATPSTYYTRAGAFHVDEDGKYLVNPDGMRLCDSTGALIDISAITVPQPVPAPADPVKFDKITNIGLDGKILYLDTSGATQVIGLTPPPAGSPPGTLPTGTALQIGIAAFTNEMGLEKAGGTLFKENPAKGGSGKVKVGLPTVNSKLVGRSLEQSNVDIAAQMVNLIVSQRAYSANSKTITTSDEMTQDVINLKR